MSARAAMRPARLRGDDVADIHLHRLAVHHDFHGVGPHLDLIAAEVRPDALDHAGVVALPAVLEQPLLGELLLGVDDQDLRRRIGLFQNMGHHRDALIGPRRAAEGVRRRHHAISAALRQGLDLRLEKLGLRAGLVSVRHAVLLRQVPSGNGPRPEVDARRQDEAVVSEAGPAREPHAPLVAVDGDRPVVHDVDPMPCGEGARNCDRLKRIRGSRPDRGSRRSRCSRLGSAPRALHPQRPSNPWRYSVPPSYHPRRRPRPRRAGAPVRAPSAPRAPSSPRPLTQGNAVGSGRLFCFAGS